jgi:hypothetical protein
MSPNESAVSELSAWRGPCASTGRDGTEVRSEGPRTGALEPETGTVIRSAFCPSVGQHDQAKCCPVRFAPVMLSHTSPKGTCCDLPCIT